MASSLNSYYLVEPMWFMNIKEPIINMFWEIMSSPMVSVVEATRKLYGEFECGWLEYKNTVYSFSASATPKVRKILYKEHPQAEIIHTVWDTFKEPLLLAQQCFAIATFHECTEEFLSMKELDIPHRQWRIVEKFYNEFHALHAVIAVRGLNE